MKYALCLRGIHYLSDSKMYVNYKESLENYKSNIIQPLKDAGHEVYIFGYTYESEKINELQQDYGFDHFVSLTRDDMLLSSTNEITLENLEKSSFQCQIRFHTMICDGIEQFERKHSMMFDYIIDTRFDLFFIDPITTHNIDWTKFNICFKHLSGSCDDNYWVFPRNYLNAFRNACNMLHINSQITHAINKYIPDIISYMYIIYPRTEKDGLNYEYKLYKFLRVKK
jgi:hypothetical protein